MPLKETTALTMGAKAGTATASIFASAVIFTDPAYIVMMAVGAFVSLASVFHTIYSDKKNKFSKMQVIAELIKGFVLGIISMPLGFLLLSEGVAGKILGLELNSLSLSLSLVGAFLFSWYMTEIINHYLKKISNSNEYKSYNKDYGSYREKDDYRGDEDDRY